MNIRLKLLQVQSEASRVHFKGPRYHVLNENMKDMTYYQAVCLVQDQTSMSEQQQHILFSYSVPSQMTEQEQTYM
jgi:hypothetical protein